MPKPLRFQQRLERFPPILIRLLTVRGPGNRRWVPTDAQLANACGLSMAEFKWASYSTSWKDLPDRVKYAYLRGCDIDLEKRRHFRRLMWMKTHGIFSHLKRSELWSVQFAEQLEIYATSPDCFAP